MRLRRPLITPLPAWQHARRHAKRHAKRHATRLAKPAWIAALAFGLITTGSGLARPARTRPIAPPSPVTLHTRATGRIEGTVEISSSLTPRRPQFRIYSEPGAITPPPPPRDPITAELRNVVVYLEGDSISGLTDDGRGESHRHGSIAQRDERFVPHIMPIVQGGTVDFPNEDDVYHNVFSLSANAAPGGKGFDLGRYPKGSSKSWTFNRQGTIQVFCHIHSDMSAIVLVLGNPFFASPDDNHRFLIDGVPEGDYTIVGWHERIKPIMRRVHVVAGQTTSLDFNIPLPQGGSQR
jgi:plastocyanin